MALKKMLLFALLVLSAVRDINPQPVSCFEDVHCMAGYFCVELTRNCHECLSCENFGRRSSIQNDCIKSSDQCGTCLPGRHNDTTWVGVCTAPHTRGWHLMSTWYGWFLITCVMTGAVLILLMAQRYVIMQLHEYDIAISPLFTKEKYQTELTA